MTPFNLFNKININNFQDSFGNFINRWLIGAILIIVAFLQIVLSHTANLSPWKGGGFGMFSSTDSPSMRVISAEGIDANGNQYWIDAWGALNSSEKKSMRSFPQKAALQHLAKNLLKSEFVPFHSNVITTYEMLKSKNPNADLQILQPIQLDELRYRVLKSKDPRPPDDQIKSFQKIRLQMWRLRVNPQGMRLWSELLIEPIEVNHSLR